MTATARVDPSHDTDPVTDLGPSPQRPRVDGSLFDLSDEGPAAADDVVGCAVAGNEARTATAAAAQLTALYRAEARYVWRSLWRLGVPTRDLEDVTHDVFVVVHRKLADFDDRRPVRPWLFGICFRVALDRRRRSSVAREQLHADNAVLDVVDTAANVHDAVVQEEERVRREAIVAAALSRLPLEQRAIFVLVDLEGLSVAACVDVVDAPLNTLYSRLRLARAAFSRAVATLMPNGLDDGGRSSP